jgi:hypothetical protein
MPALSKHGRSRRAEDRRSRFDSSAQRSHFGWPVGRFLSRSELKPRRTTAPPPTGVRSSGAALRFRRTRGEDSGNEHEHQSGLVHWRGGQPLPSYRQRSTAWEEDRRPHHVAASSCTQSLPTSRTQAQAWTRNRDRPVAVYANVRRVRLLPSGVGGRQRQVSEPHALTMATS